MNPPTTADTLYELFPASADRSALETLTPDEMPEPYRRLLVHTHHMTVTVEEFYGQPVDVEVLEVASKDDLYARKIILRLRGDRRVVQYGIVAIDLSLLSEHVRTRIVEGHTPLGRVLIENNVLRHIEPAGYFRTVPTPTMCRWLELDEPEPLYGRLGVIHTDGRPAINVMEILSPCPSTIA